MKDAGDDLILTPVPALVAVLLAEEKAKGEPLTQKEVEEIRDRAECIAMPPHARKAVDETRGYQDIDPERVWEEWQRVRPGLLEAGREPGLEDEPDSATTAESEAMNEYEQNILSNINVYGCSVTSVFDPDGEEPPFTYSIGIGKSAQAPELIVVGLKAELSHWLVNEYNRRVRDGEHFQPGVLYLGFLEGFAVQFGPVDREFREEYMCSATWLHEGADFEALQLIWPGTTGVWPWDPEASEWLRDNQPLLSEHSRTAP